MKSRYLIYSILLCAVSVFPSCQKTGGDAPRPEQEPVSLSLSFTSPKVGIYSEPDTKAGTDDIIAAVDGSRIFSLFVMLIKLDDTDTTTPDWDKDGTLVAYRALYKPNKYDEGNFIVEGDAPDFSKESDGGGFGDNGFCEENGVVTDDYSSPFATVNFKYLKPLHGSDKSCEKLLPGEYKMLAVANYRGRKDDAIEVPGIDNGQMKALIQAIKKDFNAEADNGGIRNFLSKPYDITWKSQKTGADTSATGLKIRDYRLDVANAGHVCPKTTQLLTFDRVLTLMAGNNVIDETLEKTYARLRIIVDNDHPEAELTVHSLELGTMTQSESPLFVKDDGMGSQYAEDRVAPVMDAPNAIVQFVQDTKVDGDSHKTIFDAYLLESRFDPAKLSASDAGFYFRTVVEYKDKTYSAKYTVIKRDADDNPLPVYTVQELNDWINKRNDSGQNTENQQTSNFLMRSQTGSIYNGSKVEEKLGSFIYAEGSQVLTTPTRSDIIEDPMVWEIQGWKYYRENWWSEYYYRGYIHNANGYLVCPKTSSESPLVTQARRSFIRFDDAKYGNRGTGTDNGVVYDNRALHLTDQGTYNVLAMGPDANSSYYKYPYLGWPDASATAANDRVHWSLYPLGGGQDVHAARDSYKVPLKRLNADNTQEDITEIKRGDFLTIRIIVNLNEEKKDFEFVVEPWTSGGSHDMVFE